MTVTPKRNWGAVVITIAAAFELIANLFGSNGTLLLAATVLVPLALVVGVAPLAFGARGLQSIAGSGIRSRLLLFTAALFAGIAQFAVIVISVGSYGADEDSVERATSASLFLEIFAILVAFIAGIAVARARVARGYARWSLIVAVVLIAVTLILGYSDVAASWQDVPRAVGLLALGISYWRVGLVPAPAKSARVTAGPKSLAE